MSIEIPDTDNFENDLPEADRLRKAIWDMMNFANMYVLVLDEKMNIKFANYSLYKALGFTKHNSILGKCWLDFIRREDNNTITSIHSAISMDTDDAKRFTEYTNDIVTLNGDFISVKWFNAHINHTYNWAFSIGIQTEKQVMITAESVRNYYKQVIENDRTMILSLRNSIINTSKIIDSCDPDFKKE